MQITRSSAVGRFHTVVTIAGHDKLGLSTSHDGSALIYLIENLDTTRKW